ncbi:MAG: hypothetical protein AAF449_00440 [Myxococcota bacterium]
MLRLKSGEDIHAGRWTDAAQAEAVGKAIIQAAPLARLESIERENSCEAQAADKAASSSGDRSEKAEMQVQAMTALSSLVWRGADRYFAAVPGCFVQAGASSSIAVSTGSVVRTFQSTVSIDASGAWPPFRPSPASTYFKPAPGCLLESPALSACPDDLDAERIARLQVAVGTWAEPTPPPRFPPERAPSSNSEWPQMRRSVVTEPTSDLDKGDGSARGDRSAKRHEPSDGYGPTQGHGWAETSDSARAGLMQPVALPETDSEATWAVDYYRALTQPGVSAPPVTSEAGDPTMPSEAGDPTMPSIPAPPPAILRIPGFNDEPEAAETESPLAERAVSSEARAAAVELVRSAGEELPTATVEYAARKL